VENDPTADAAVTLDSGDFLGRTTNPQTKGYTMASQVNVGANVPSTSGMGSKTSGTSGGSHKVSNVMSKDWKIANETDTVLQVCHLMKQHNVGYLPVGNGERLLGMITDRDIVTRVLAAGKDLNSPIKDFYTKDVKYTYEDLSCADVAKNMGELGLRRLPVMSRDKKIVGVIALGDIAQCCPEIAGTHLAQIYAKKYQGRYSK
jgi:CBS domain-containing protein